MPGEGNKKNIKLLIITPSLHCGGSERYVSTLCNHIDTEKFDVTLVVLNNRSPFYKINRPGIDVVDLNVPTVRRSFFKISKVVKSVKPDLIFTTANHLNLFFAIFKRMVAGNIKIIARESSIVSIQKKQEKLTWLFNRLMKIYYNRLDLIICQSLFMQRDLLEQYHIQKEKTIVINNPAVLPASGLLSNSIKKNNTGVYKFITVARLSREKGIARLIKAMRYLKVPFTYHIMGEGPERQALEHLITAQGLSGKVILEGPKEEPYSNMEDADLFLMGSYHEGFPNVLTEAGMLGIPVLAFDAPGGIKEIIVEGENGFLVKEDDAILFAAAINKALLKDFDKSKIRQQTIERFSADSIIKKVEGVFMDIYSS